MLVLSRKPTERIKIGENIWVTVVRIGPNRVQLGIDAPRDLAVLREEVFDEAPPTSAAQLVRSAISGAVP